MKNTERALIQIADVNKILLKRMNKLIIPQTSNPATFISSSQREINQEIICRVVKLSKAVGYILSRKLLKSLLGLNPAKLAELEIFLKDQFTLLKGNSNYTEQVVETKESELFSNSILQYISLGKETFKYEIKERSNVNPSDVEEPIVIKLGFLNDFKQLAINLITSKTSTSPEDKDIIKLAIKIFSIESLELGMISIPNKENLTFTYAETVKAGQYVPTMDLVKHFCTPTDVLRLAVAISDGDVSLAESSKFITFNRATRRLLMDMLEQMPLTEAILDTQKYTDRWKRLGEKLHPCEFKGYPNVVQLFKHIRNGDHLQTINGKIEEKFKSRNLKEVIELLKSSPEVFARSLDRLLREFNNFSEQYYVISEFSTVAENVASTVLLQVRDHFRARTKATPSASNTNITVQTRIFLPKGGLAKAYVKENIEMASISTETCELVVKVCEEALVRIYSKREPLGRVFVSDTLKNHKIPTSQRSASNTLYPITRCSALPFSEDTRIIRTFIAWQHISVVGNGSITTNKVDIDLSTLILDNNLNTLDPVSYNNLNHNTRSSKELDNCIPRVVHSGDSTAGAADTLKYIDLDLEILNKYYPECRYVAFEVSSLTGQQFSQIPECYFGWTEKKTLGQEREMPRARTVINKFDLKSNGVKTLVMLIDLKEKKIIWLDVTLSGFTGLVNAKSSKHKILLLTNGFLSQNRTNLYELVKFNVEGRGISVERREDADIVFLGHGETQQELTSRSNPKYSSKFKASDRNTYKSIKKQEVISVYNIDKFMVDFI